MFRLSWTLGASTSWHPHGLSWPVMGLLFLYYLQLHHECHLRNPLMGPMGLYIKYGLPSYWCSFLMDLSFIVQVNQIGVCNNRHWDGLPYSAWIAVLVTARIHLRLSRRNTRVQTHYRTHCMNLEWKSFFFEFRTAFKQILTRLQLKCDGTRWRTGG